MNGRILVLVSIWAHVICLNHVCPPQNDGTKEHYTVWINTQQADIPSNVSNVTLSCLVSGKVDNVVIVRWYLKSKIKQECPPYHHDHPTSIGPSNTYIKTCNVTVTPTEMEEYICTIYDRWGIQMKTNRTALAKQVRDGLPLSPSVFGLQRGLWQRIPCLALRHAEEIDGLNWYKVISDTNKTKLVGKFLRSDDVCSTRHNFSSDGSLLFKGVTGGDEGKYLCRVIRQKTNYRDKTVDVNVIGNFFPTSQSARNASESLQRGRRQTLQCQCTCPHELHVDAISVVYWSRGEGVSNDTDIIAARFADGSVVQIQHGASYGIGSDFSLQINCLVGFHDEQRFWCHVFKSDGARSSCYTDVWITGQRPSDSKLLASKPPFYLLNGKPAVLPCTNWKPDDQACNVQWFKVGNNLDLHPLLSANSVRTGSGFELVSNFDLFIPAVNDSHTGRYYCNTDGERTIKGVIDVRVIGKKFPLGDSDVHVGETVKRKPDTTLTLACRAKSSKTTMNTTTIFWSFGAPDEQQSTTVIGSLVLPERIWTMSDLEDHGCYGISYEGRLILTNCSQDNGVRYWCHVFKEGDKLHRSYVDVTVALDVLTPPGPVVTASVVVPVCTFLATVGLVAASGFVYRRRRKRNDNKSS